MVVGHSGRFASLDSLAYYSTAAFMRHLRRRGPTRPAAGF